MMVVRKLDLHTRTSAFPTPLVLGGVVDWALAPWLNMVPGSTFWFWDLIPGVQKTQSPRDPQPSLILKRKQLH